ncbi:MAG: heparinase II/III family protein [bacterium]
MRNFVNIFVLFLAILVGFLDISLSAAAARSLHPHFYFTQEDWIAIQDKITRTDAPEYGTIANSVVGAANQVVKRDVPIYSTPGEWPHRYACDGKGDGNDDPNDGCGGFLLFQEDRPYDHICPRCGRVYRGSPYDEAWVSLYNDRVARHIRNLGLAYLISGDLAYAQKAADLCLQYANLYSTFPLHDISGGASHTAGRLYAQTLDEAVWIFEFLWGLDAIFDSPALSQNDRDRITEYLLYPIVSTLSRTDLGMSNYQSWVSSAIGAIGFFLEDDLLIDHAINGQRGYRFLLDNAYGADGFSYEGSIAYHYYGFTPLFYLARISERAGISLWDDVLRRALVTPLYLVQPDGRFSRVNDAGPTHLSNLVNLYEIANGLSDDPIFDQVLTEVYQSLGYQRTHYFALFLGKDFEDSNGLTLSGDAPESLGIKVLRSRAYDSTLMALLDRGPHGGAHGHYDKLNLILFGQGRELLPDLGSGSYVADLLYGWLRRTIAHNTVLVGESDQLSGDERPSLLTFNRTNFSSVQVVSAEPALGVYSGDTKIERTLIKVDDDYLIVFDEVADAEPPIDVIWHSLGRFVSPEMDSLDPTNSLDRWNLSTSGYQYLQPPEFVTGEPADNILQIPPTGSPTRITWQLPLGLTDDLEDLSLWDGEFILSGKRTEGANSLRFLAVPNSTVSVGKDLSHPRLDLSSLKTLEFDYFLDEGQVTSFWVILQHLPFYDRTAWRITSVEPGIWHHGVIDLQNPDAIFGGADRRTRLDFAVSATGNPEDSFFVYIDNIQAKSAANPEKPLLTGLTANVISKPAASYLLADGPGLRLGERHSVLLSRVPETPAVFFTLLETYFQEPRWSISEEGAGTYRVSSNDAIDLIHIDSGQHAYSVARYNYDGDPERLVLLNRTSGEIGLCSVSAREAIDLELQISASNREFIQYSYQSGSGNDSFNLKTAVLDPYMVVLVDGLEWEGAVIRSEETIEITGLPGGIHRVDLFSAMTSVDKWKVR